MISTALHAEEPNQQEVEKLLRLPLEDLLQLTINTAGKRQERVSDIPASVTIITRADIADHGYTTLTEIIEDIPGVYNVNNYNGASANFGVRGNLNPRWQNTNFAILVNGVSQLRDDERSNPMEKIRVPVEAIDRIEFIRGPMSVIYGNGAFFGVINIITNQSQNSQTLIAGGVGSMSTSKLTARKVSKNTPFKYTLNAAFTKTDGLDNKFNKMMTADNFTSLPGIGITDPDYSTDQLLEDKSAYVNFNGDYNGFYIDATNVLAESELFFLYPSIDDGTVDNMRNTNITLGYKFKPVPSWGLDTKISYNNYDLTTNIDLLYPGFYGKRTVNYESYEGEIISNHSITDKLNLIFGADYRTMRHLKDFVAIPDLGVNDELVLISNRNTWGLYSQATYNMTELFSIIAGYRFETIEKFDYNGFVNAGSASETTFGGPRDQKINRTPRIAGIYKIDNSQNLKLMHGIASRVSDDKFEPEIIETSEINYVHNYSNFILNASLYKNNMENLVVKRLDVSGSSISEKDSPTGKVTTDGFEVIVDAGFSKSLTAMFSIAIQDSRDRTNDNIDPGFSPRYVAHTKVSYRKTNNTYAFSARYVDSMNTLYNPAIDNGDGTYGARVGEKVSEYFVLDANFRKEKIYKQFYINLHVTNLFDKEIHYPNEAFYTEILNKGTIGPGRAFFATIGFDI